MKRYTGVSAGFIAVWMTCALSLTASANSSWHWISSTRPYDLLPIVIAVTLMVETFAIARLAKVQPFSKVFCMVLLANSVSFAVPYIGNHTPYTFVQALEHVPMYTVGAAYLVVTLLAEMPVVYLTLRKHTDRPKRLLWVTLGANAVTTVLTALAERLFCHGSW